MKTSELMISDWVNITGQFIKVVEKDAITSVKHTPIGTRPSKINCLTDNAMYCDAPTTGEYTFEPIPLTEEILKANGIPETELKGFFQARNSRCTITIDLADVNIRGELHSDTASFMMRFRYVHELQHALRLCGLNELADNFVLE